MLLDLDKSFPGYFQDINIQSAFGYEICSKHIANLWELVLLGEPLLILADLPSSTSDAVLALISLISPLTYFGDYRPYFTIFDPDFKKYSRCCEVKTLPPCIIGVTNPFFLKAYTKWPNVLNFGEGTKLRTKLKFAVKDGWKNISKQLLQGEGREVEAINNSLLRRHLRELTYCFLQPFQEYLTSHDDTSSPYGQMNGFTKFNEKQFIKD